MLEDLVFRVDKRPIEWFKAFMSGEYPRSNLAIEGETAFFSTAGVELGMREAEVTCARILISSNGVQMTDSTAPAAIPAMRASEA